MIKLIKKLFCKHEWRKYSSVEFVKFVNDFLLGDLLVKADYLRVDKYVCDKCSSLKKSVTRNITHNPKELDAKYYFDLINVLKYLFDVYPNCNFITIDPEGITGYKSEPHIETLDGFLVYISKTREEFDEEVDYNPDKRSEILFSLGKEMNITYKGKLIFNYHADSDSYQCDDWDIPSLIRRNGDYTIRKKYKNEFEEKSGLFS